MPKKKAYGLHLMIDGYDANPGKLASVDLLYQTLNALPSKMGMQKVGFPHIIQFREREIAGLSGFIFIVESHISIHTYSTKRFIAFDAFSCKTFDPKKILSCITATYEIRRIETYLVERGKKFPAGRNA